MNGDPLFFSDVTRQETVRHWVQMQINPHVYCSPPFPLECRGLHDESRPCPRSGREERDAGPANMSDATTRRTMQVTSAKLSTFADGAWFSAQRPHHKDVSGLQHSQRHNSEPAHEAGAHRGESDPEMLSHRRAHRRARPDRRGRSALARA